MSAKSDGLPLPVEPGHVDPEPDWTAFYWSDAFTTLARVRPSDITTDFQFRSHPTDRRTTCGHVRPGGYIGGERVTGDPNNHPPIEAVWRLELTHVWRDGRLILLAKKVLLDGRYVLRSGRFVELAEDAI